MSIRIIKKTCAIVSIITIMVSNSYGQKPYPKSIIDLSVGLGPNYGLIGLKTVIGLRGNGFMVGLGGRTPTPIMLGFQLSGKHVFMNFGIGPYAVAKPASSYTPEEFSLVKGKVFMVGGKANFGKSNIFFLEGGVGYAFDGHFEIPYYGTIEAASAFVLGVGLGVRIGNIKNTPDMSQMPAN